ncbi:aminodeoxychorismate synthase component I [Aerosticca soli]|uniref:aminodeoxychorismate synthase component I n=1 Tax=Aerosticca soli TaxID=2010829 RepID=UPI000F82A754|nr:aminodeoxychorismate synthase component I [Aerosticca soli]
MVCRRRPGRPDLLAAAAARPARYPALLQSAAQGTAQARYDLLFGFPQQRLCLTADGVLSDDGTPVPGDDFLAALDAAWRRERRPTAADGLPFHGGWVLFLAYEMAARLEPRLQLPHEPALPLALALRCPVAAIVDHARDCTWLVAEAAHADRLDVLAADLASTPAPMSLPAPMEIAEDDSADFLDGVARIHAHLRAGDVFQVNLSRRWRATYAAAPAPAALYAALRRANPAPFAGLLQQPGWAIVSSSPERLVEVRDGVAQTRPIAGTRPRLPGEDEAARIDELVAHPKERAEHVMLIDLERNDLGRVCVPGTIRVDECMTVESYAHVHHIVSNVSGRLREGITPGQAIAATFPGGTITGCPKVRCMEIIAALERAPRGAYTGALGYLDLNGDMDLNILIRTFTAIGEAVSLRAGAGIVVDSVAEAELAETRAKARGLLRALGADA